MIIYFYDNNKRYIGHRSITDNEQMPLLSTTIPVSITDGTEAHFIDGNWAVTPIQTRNDGVPLSIDSEVLDDLIDMLVAQGVITNV